jgi:hypothetical protein
MVAILARRIAAFCCRARTPVRGRSPGTSSGKVDSDPVFLTKNIVTQRRLDTLPADDHVTKIPAVAMRHYPSGDGNYLIFRLDVEIFCMAKLRRKIDVIESYRRNACPCLELLCFRRRALLNRREAFQIAEGGVPVHA